MTDSEAIPLVGRALPELEHYMATFYWDGQEVGSGTFVNTLGLDGILTAYHVAKKLFDVGLFSFCLSQTERTAWRSKEQLEHVPVGVPEDLNGTDGPDLSFIIIRDAQLAGTIKSKKSFCFLESQDTESLKLPLDRMRWALTGTAQSECKPSGELDSDGESVIGLVKLAASPKFGGYRISGQYDYVELLLPCGSKPCLYDYRGLSGGGLWVIPFAWFGNGAVTYRRPILAGVQFSQSAPNDGWRTLTGHGFNSIYTRVKEALGAHKR